MAPDEEALQRGGQAGLRQQLAGGELANDHCVVPGAGQDVQVAVEAGVAEVPGEGDEEGGEEDEGGMMNDE